jgi:TolA-binding protein
MTVVFAGCLKTRADLRGETEDPTPQRQTVEQQRAEAREQRSAPAVKPPPATAASRFEEYDEQMRQLNGRVDVIENMVGQYNAAAQGDKLAAGKDKEALDQRFQIFEEALKKLEAQVQSLTDEVAHLKAPSAAAGNGSAAGKARSPYDEGESLFAARKWKEAIVAFQKYRDGNPKGRKYADATYKIGVAFQELGMRDEAKAFYGEVVAKFHGSKEAKKAAFRMKSLK